MFKKHDLKADKADLID